MGKNLQIIMVIGHLAEILLYTMQNLLKKIYFHQNLINYHILEKNYL